MFGQAVSEWVQNFLGLIGTLALLLFALVAVFVWNNNPDLTDFSWQKLWYETRRAWEDLLTGNYAKRRPTPPPVAKSPISPLGATEEFEDITATLGSAGQNTPAVPKPTAEAAGQLSFDLSQKSALFADPPTAKLPKTGEAELEINLPPVETAEPVTPDQAQAYKPPVEVVQEDNPNLSEPYDPTLELSHYEYPHLQLLVDHDNSVLEIDREELETNKNQIIQTLLHFKIEIEKIRATIGPTVTLYEIIPARGVRISKSKPRRRYCAEPLGARHPYHRADPRQGHHRYRGAEQKPPDRGDARGAHERQIQTRQNGPAHRPGQNYRQRSIRGRPDQNAPPAHRRRHRPGQIRGHQRRAHVAAVQKSTLRRSSSSSSTPKVELFPYAKSENHFWASCHTRSNRS